MSGTPDPGRGAPIARRIGLLAGITGLAGLAGGLIASSAHREHPPSPSRARGQHTHDVSREAIGDGFEVKDLSAKGLTVILLVLAVSATVLVAIVFAMIALFGHWNREQYAPIPFEQRALVLPPAPRVQADPKADLAAERSREAEALASTGWNDAAHTSAHLSIDRAKALAVGHSLDEAP